MKISYFLQKNNQKLTQGGFTIIETLVAIAILMISIAGPLTIAQKGLLSAQYAHDQVTATYLAQDAMEYVKNVRDNNLLNGRDWLDKLSQCTSTSVCSIDTLTGNPNAGAGQTAAAKISNCSSSCLLYLTSSGYTPNSGASGAVPTQYSRSFYISRSGTNVNNPDEAKVTVMVSWKNGAVDNVVTYDGEIFNVLK